MKNSLITAITVIISIAILIFIGNHLVSIKAIPSLGEYMASSTINTNATSDTNATLDTNATSSADINTTSSKQNISNASTTAIVTPKGLIQTEIADTVISMEKGLGGRMSLPTDHGMLFIFLNSDVHSFWMKDMFFPIDMVWIDSNKDVVGVTADVSPDSYPAMFNPPSPIMYVLELNAGSAESYDIATGTKLMF